MNSSLPEPLRGRLSRGEWIRTAHRGAPKVAPGNTLRSILAALAFGVDLVEIDVHRTPDGRLVLWHDDHITSGLHRYAVDEVEFSTLYAAVEKSLGEELIDLPLAIQAVAGKAGLMVDLKADMLAGPIMDCARAATDTPLVVCGDYRDTLREIRASDRSIGTSLTLDRSYRLRDGTLVPEQFDTDAVTIAYQIAEGELIARCHELGIAVLAWTVDDLPLMRRLLAADVDGLTSNRADLFASVDEPPRS